MVPTPYGMVRLTITIFSRAFNIPRSAFYRAAQPPPRKGDLRLVAAIKDILDQASAIRLSPSHESPSPKAHSDQRQTDAAAYAFARLADISRCGARRWRGGHAAGELANLSQFSPTAPDQLWVTDITFVRLRSHWIYLAVMVDAFSRRCIGWALGTRITTELTLEALRMAIVSRRPKATLVHHSDRGSQYGSSGVPRRIA